MDNAAVAPTIEDLRQQLLAVPSACALLAYRVDRMKRFPGYLTTVWDDPSALELLVWHGCRLPESEMRVILAVLNFEAKDADRYAELHHPVRAAESTMTDDEVTLHDELKRIGSRFYKDPKNVR